MFILISSVSLALKRGIQFTLFKTRNAKLSSFTLEVKSAAREGVYEPGNISVVIRSHEEAETGTVQDLISVCQTVKLESFTLRDLNLSLIHI